MGPIASEQEHEAVDLRVSSRGEVSSGLIRAHQGSSGLISAHPGSSALIRAHQGRSPRASSRADHPADVHTFGS